MYKVCQILYCAGSDVWVSEPTLNGVIIYSIITPILALCGIIGNILSLLILTRKEFASSTYTYLSVLAVTDLASSVFLLISGLCRGILWWVEGWREYEAIIAVPIGGIFNCWAVAAIVAVTFDRIVYIWKPTRVNRPGFCQPKVAQIVMLLSFCVSILFNVPYCFMYTRNEEGALIMTKFVQTPFYTAHNWTKLIVFAILPALLLLIGNGFLIHSLRNLYSIKESLMRRCNKANPSTRDQKWVTSTLVAMVFFFLIGEIPTHLVSRTSAVTLLFFGDEERADESRELEVFRQIATLMNGLNLAFNFGIYYMFCSQFRRCFYAMFSCLPRYIKRRRPKNRCRMTQVNVFIVDPYLNCNRHPSCTAGQVINVYEEKKFAVNVVTTPKIY